MDQVPGFPNQRQLGGWSCRVSWGLSPYHTLVESSWGCFCRHSASISKNSRAGTTCGCMSFGKSWSVDELQKNVPVDTFYGQLSPKVLHFIELPGANSKSRDQSMQLVPVESWPEHKSLPFAAHPGVLGFCKVPWHTEPHWRLGALTGTRRANWTILGSCLDPRRQSLQRLSMALQSLKL